MQIDYRKFTDITADNMRFYVSAAGEARTNKNPLGEQISMGSAAALFYSWTDVVEMLPAEATKADSDKLKAIIQAVNPNWPPTEEIVNSMENEIKSMLK